LGFRESSQQATPMMQMGLQQMAGDHLQVGAAPNQLLQAFRLNELAASLERPNFGLANCCSSPAGRDA
jgi:hypothetical protein